MSEQIIFCLFLLSAIFLFYSQRCFNSFLCSIYYFDDPAKNIQVFKVNLILFQKYLWFLWSGRNKNDNDRNNGDVDDLFSNTIVS